ncbi:MAG: coat protein [Spirochaetes bacterium]|nr:coat protein [Spirochaetota bacterium]
MNKLENLIKTVILPLALPVLRESVHMPHLVNTSYGEEAAKRGAVITVPLPQDLGDAEDVDTINGNPPRDLRDDTVEIKLDKWKQKTFKMNDKELWEAEQNAVLPSALESSIKALANSIDKDLLSLHRDIPFWAGKPGVTPAEKTSLIDVRKILQKNLVPMSDRSLVLDVEAEAELLDLLSDAQKNGDNITAGALREAFLGRLFGFDNFVDQNIVPHIAGTLTTGTTRILAVEAGRTRVSVDGGAGAETIKKGDRFSIAGVDGYFVFTEDATAVGGAVSSVGVYPAIPAGVGPNTSIQIVSDHTPNLAFHKNAFALAVRTLDDSESESSTIATAVDSVSGLPLRIETWRDSKLKCRLWSVDVLYGVKTIRPELAAILAG